MAYENFNTIADTLKKIRSHQYVLPAIQREFVWKPRQICRLFDSMMRGYPIGSFLFWKVERQHVRDFRYYDFVTRYHEQRAPHCPALDELPDGDVVAVLDGQQRITALNIGLRGSHAEKEPRKRWSNPDAFPEKRLYLNLRRPAEENEDGLRYDFRFLADERAAERDEHTFWFPVPRVMDLPAGPDMLEFLVSEGVGADPGAYRMLDRLHTVVHRERAINFHLEEEQDLHHVLDIFIRVNSGGTVLSYSDLLLSIATAEWDEHPAREAIHELVDELNQVGSKFSFSKDFVLKAGLMLSDVASVGFKVTNFTRENMRVLQANWKAVGNALRLTVRLAADFGFSGQTLSADSALLPIAYYLYRRGETASYLSRRDTQDDREAIRGWLIRSMLKSGIWGSGLDTLLTAIRAAIRQHGAQAFPVDAIESELAHRGRSLRFGDEEIEDLLDLGSGDRRTFPLLSLMYPYFGLHGDFHVDHVYPRARLTDARLRGDGLSPDEVARIRPMVDRLPNLQLLTGGLNTSKNDQLPHDWIAGVLPGPDAEAEYRARHDLPELPRTSHEFPEFFTQRRRRMKARLHRLLGMQPAQPAAGRGGAPA